MIPMFSDAYFWMFVAVLGWFLFAMQTWKKAITKEEVVATYERLSNEIEREVIRMAEDLAKDPHNLFLLKTGYQHIVFNPDGVRARPSSPPACLFLLSTFHTCSFQASIERAWQTSQPPEHLPYAGHSGIVIMAP